MLGFCRVQHLQEEHRNRIEAMSLQIDAYNVDDLGFRIQNSV